MIRRTLLALMLALPVTQALATGEIERLITPADRARLKQYDTIRKTALDQAHRGGSTADVATLNALLAKKRIAFGKFDMTGNWQCRTIKTDGAPPLVINGWFKCRVTDDGSGWYLEKADGFAAHQRPLLYRQRHPPDLSRRPP